MPMFPPFWLPQFVQLPLISHPLRGDTETTLYSVSPAQGTQRQLTKENLIC